MGVGESCEWEKEPDCKSGTVFRPTCYPRSPLVLVIMSIGYPYNIKSEIHFCFHCGKPIVLVAGGKD